MFQLEILVFAQQLTLVTEFSRLKLTAIFTIAQKIKISDFNTLSKIFSIWYLIDELLKM